MRFLLLGDAGVSDDDRDAELRRQIYRIIELQNGKETAEAVRADTERADAFADRKREAENNTGHLPHTYGAGLPFVEGRAGYVRRAGDYKLEQKAAARFRKRLHSRGDLHALKRDIAEVTQWAFRVARKIHNGGLDKIRQLERLNMPPEVAKRLELAATQGGRLHKDHAWAVNCYAIGAVLYLGGASCGRAGFDRVVCGIGRGLLKSFTRSPRGGAYSLSTFANRRHAGPGLAGTEGQRGGLGGDFRKGECGILEALRQARFLDYHQPRADVVPDWQRGPKGYAYNQYWVRTVGIPPGLSGLEPAP